MINLVERELIKKYKFSSYVIGNLQQAFAKGFLDDVETESEKEDIQNYINDKYDFIESYSSNYNKEFVCNRILHVDTDNVETYLEIFTEKFEALLKNIGIEKVIVIFNEKCDWFYQKNSYKPVKDAMSALRKIVGNKHYFGAFEVETTSINQITDIIYWLGRCNASLPYIHIISEESKVSFMICQYGNLHAEIYSTDVDIKLVETCKKLGFEIIEKEEEFLGDGFKGRKIIVSDS